MLSLGGNQLTGPVPTELSRLPNLAMLDIDDNQPPLAATSTPSTAVSFSDRDILVAFYEATGGANWSDKSNWLSDAPIDEWHGVTTYGSGRVTELGLSGNQLSGEIPTWLGNLVNLELLALQDNQLNGEIPTELGNLANLEDLYLDGNQLSGEIPPELGDLANLKAWTSTITS